MEKKFYFTKEYDDAVYSLSYIAFQIFKYIKAFLKPYHYKIILISKNIFKNTTAKYIQQVYNTIKELVDSKLIIKQSEKYIYKINKELFL